MGLSRDNQLPSDTGGMELPMPVVMKDSSIGLVLNYCDDRLHPVLSGTVKVGVKDQKSPKVVPTCLKDTEQMPDSGLEGLTSLVDGAMLGEQD